MILFEKTIKENAENNKDKKQQISEINESDKSMINIKRSITLNVIKTVGGFSNETFKRNLLENLFKLNQQYKLENSNNNHPTLKLIFKIFGLPNGRNNEMMGGINDKKFNDKGNNKNIITQDSKKDILNNNELVKFQTKDQVKQEQEIKVNFSKKNIDNVRKLREKFVQQQEDERKKYIEQINNDAKNKEKLKKM